MAKRKSNDPTWSELKPCIIGMDQKQLVKLVADMYRFSKDNQVFLHTRFGVGKDPLAPYKEKIDGYMFPDMYSNKPIQIAKAKKTISDYSKAVGNAFGEIELMVFFVECGNNFTLSYGDMDEGFYDSINGMYRRAIKKILKLPEKQQEEFRERLKEIMTSTSHIGWGYHDILSQDYYFAFPEIE